MRNVLAATCAVVVIVSVLGAGAAPVTAGPSASADATVECSYPFTVTDATGTEVTLEEEPQRIVTLAPSAAQTVWEFNASDKVVGVSDNAGYLEGAENKTIVSERMTIKPEVIVGLEPDVVLAPDVVGDEDVQTLRDNGLTVYKFEDPKNFSGVYDTVERTGELSGECEEATATVTDMRDRVTAIENALSDEEKHGAVYTFFGWTAGSNTFIDSILTTAGTENVAATAGVDGFGQLNEEVVANNSEDIEWLVLNDNPASHPSGDVWNSTTAMQEDRVVTVNENYLNQPAPRVVVALETITKAIHPAAYEEAQAALEATPTPTATAEPTATPTATETAGTTETTTQQTDTETATDTPTVTATPSATNGGGPGFTDVTGVVALLAAVLLFRRR